MDDITPVREDRSGDPIDAEIGSDVIFDVTALLDYFESNRLPTGIQRVELALIEAMSRLSVCDSSGVSLCRYSERRGGWAEVSVADFLHAARLCTQSDVPVQLWGRVRDRLATGTGRLLSPRRGSRLFNIGTSWWSTNYFMHVRELKRRHGIRFIVVVHDVIPIVLPDECGREHVQRFFDWFVGVLQHADVIITTSDSASKDVVAAAAAWGFALPPERVARLPLASGLPGATSAERRPEDVLRDHGLTSTRYVLSVGTVEARKDQLCTVEAWRRLLATMNAVDVPMLVLAGKTGHQAERVLDRLAASPALAAKVMIVSDIGDETLDALYRHCLFTIFASRYEGWGLPLTESLAVGKVPVFADNSSLSEVAQGCGIKFATGSSEDLSRVAGSLFDDRERRRREGIAARRFAPRTWDMVARECREIGNRCAGLEVFPKLNDGFYPLHRNRALVFGTGVGSAEALRSEGWWELEDFGSWTKRSGGVLRFRSMRDCLRLRLELVGLPKCATEYTVQAGAQSISGVINAGVNKWIVLNLDIQAHDELALSVRSALVNEVVDPDTGVSRVIGVGLSAIYVSSNKDTDLSFIEAIALGLLEDQRGDLASLLVTLAIDD